MSHESKHVTKWNKEKVEPLNPSLQMQTFSGKWSKFQARTSYSLIFAVFVISSYFLEISLFFLMIIAAIYEIPIMYVRLCTHIFSFLMIMHYCKRTKEPLFRKIE